MISARVALADAGALDLGAQFLVLDELSRVFHGKDHGTGRVPLGRGSLAVADLKAVDGKEISLLERVREREQFSGIVLLFLAGVLLRVLPCFCLGGRVLFLVSVSVLERPAHDLEESECPEHFCGGKQRFLLYAHNEL